MSVLVSSRVSLWLRPCVFTLAQIHIPPSYALCSLCTDAVGNRCRENGAFCCCSQCSLVLAGSASAWLCSWASVSDTATHWDKGSRKAKAFLSRGRVAAARSEVTGMVFGAGGARMKKDRELGAVRMGVCKPNGAALLGPAGRCCAAGAPPLPQALWMLFTGEHPAWVGDRVAFLKGRE